MRVKIFPIVKYLRISPKASGTRDANLNEPVFIWLSRQRFSPPGILKIPVMFRVDSTCQLLFKAY